MISKIILCAAFALGGISAHAEQTTVEKASSTVADAKRSMKKTGHRIDEKLCAKGDAACLAEKAKHRGQEAKDYVEDKAKEVKDKAD